MAIKTAAEMFGDGTGPNPQVPIDFANPPGFAALNRGTAFGEQVTSAIANRVAYALVLNDEDLNSRLAVWEVGGLDAAYDLGATATPGGGRTITKDSGALELLSTTTAQYQDDRANAHFRASLVGDTVSGAAALDSVSISSNSGGVLDRVRTSMVATNTDVSPTNAAQVNPGGALATTIRLTVGGSVFHTSGDTELLVGVDMVEITGGTNPGLYLVSGLGAADTDVFLVSLDGTTSPSFTANEVVTCSWYRPRVRASKDHGIEVVGLEGMQSAMRVLPALHSPDVGDGEGTGVAFDVRFRRATGAHTGATEIDYKGTVSYLMTSDDLLPGDRDDMGAVFTRRDILTTLEDETTHMVAASQADGPTTRLDFLSLIAPTNANHVWAGTITFTATQGELDVTSINGGAGYDLNTYAHGSLVHITGGTAAGWYLLASNSTVAPEWVIVNLDGTTPSGHPVSGTASARMYAIQALGRLPQALGIAPVLAGWTTMTPAATLAAGDEPDACALALHGSLGANGALLRGFEGGEHAAGGAKENFMVGSDGAIHGLSLDTGADVSAAGSVVAGVNLVAASGTVTAQSGVTSTTGNVRAAAGDVIASAGDLVATLGDVNILAGDAEITLGDVNLGAGNVNVIASGGVRYPALTVRNLMIPPSLWMSTVTGVTRDWNYFAASESWIAANANGKEVTIPIRIPTGATLRGFEVVVNPIDGTNTLTVEMFKRAVTNWGTGAIGSVTSLQTAVPAAGSAQQTIGNTPITELIDNDSTTYWLRITGSTTLQGDQLLAARVYFYDPGPRNH